MKSIVFPGYTLLSELGYGGLSTVYLARQDVLSREVAFKVMSASVARQEGFGERFLREAHIVASLNHRNIVQVYDTGEIQGNFFLAMEYLPKGDLTALEGNPVPIPDTLRVVSSVLEALEFAASRGVVHRDVKPANVMFRDDGTIVLVDFGIAFRDEPEERVTKIGTIIGTPRYMSPEQFDGRDVDERTDIYSVGIVLFELLTGAVPYDGNSAVDIGISHRSDPVPRLPEHLQAFQPILDTALAKHPDDRFRNAGEFLSALSGLSGSVYAGATSTPDIRSSGEIREGEDFLQKMLASRREIDNDENNATRIARPKTNDITQNLSDIAATVAMTGDGRSHTATTGNTEGQAGLRDPVAVDWNPGTSGPRVSRGIIALLATAIVSLGIVAVYFIVQLEADSGDGRGAMIADTGLRETFALQRDDIIRRSAALSPVRDELSRDRIELRYQDLIDNESQRNREEMEALSEEIYSYFEQLLLRSDRRVIIGSTDQQIDAAYLICKAIDPGCERSWYASETLREATLSPFRLAANEVSIADFRTFVGATGYVSEAEERGYSYSYFKDGVRRVTGLSWQQPFAQSESVNDNWPVMHISAADALYYCEWSGGRLPTAEEWEYAARGPERRIYTWGDTWDPALAPIRKERPSEVGTLIQDAFFPGITALTGNVWEWVSLPTGAYGLKGGSYREFNPANMRTAVSRDAVEGLTQSDDGMRCAFDVQEWPESRRVR